MSKPKAPKPPDPKIVAAAQTGANVSTAVANAWLGNPSEYSRDGSTEIRQTGTTQIVDPANGQVINVPLLARVTQLAPQQEAIAQQNDRAALNLSTLAANQSGFLGNYLSQPVNAASLGPRPTAPTLNTNPGALPSLSSNIGATPALTTSLGAQPTLTTSIGATPSLTTSLGAQPTLRQAYDTEFTADRARTEEALFSRLNPQFERDREALATRLANQGIRAGSAAYDREMNNFGQNVNDARMQAILASGQEQSRLADLARQSAAFGNDAAQQAFLNRVQQATFQNQANQQDFVNRAQQAAFQNQALQQGFDNRAQQAVFQNQATQQDFANRLQSTDFANQVNQQRFGNELQRAGFANSALMDQFNAATADRAQLMNEQFALRNQPINEITALLSGGQVNQPQFMGANMPRIPTTDYAGIMQQDFNNRMGAYQQQMGAQQGLLGGLLGATGTILGGPIGGLMFSDERLKENVEKVGKLDGHNLYSYNYKGDPAKTKHVGVMAQEVEKKRPDAVAKTSDGVRMVDYGGLFGKKDR